MQEQAIVTRREIWTFLSTNIQTVLLSQVNMDSEHSELHTIFLHVNTANRDSHRVDPLRNKAQGLGRWTPLSPWPSGVKKFIKVMTQGYQAVWFSRHFFTLLFCSETTLSSLHWYDGLNQLLTRCLPDLINPFLYQFFAL